MPPYLYSLCLTTPGRVVQTDLATQQVVKSLVITGNLAHTGGVSADKEYLYVATLNAPYQIMRIKIPEMIEAAVVSIDNRPLSILEYQGKLYVSAGNSKVYELDPVTMQVLRSVTLGTSESATGLIEVNGILYVCLSMTGTSNSLVRVNPVTLTEVDRVSIPVAQGVPTGSRVALYINGLIYVLIAGWPTPTRIVTVDPNSMTVLRFEDFPGSTGPDRLAYDGQYIYWNQDVRPSKLSRLDPTTYEFSVIEMPTAGETRASDVDIYQRTLYLNNLGLYPDPTSAGNISIINLDTFTRTGVIDLGVGNNNPIQSIVVDTQAPPPPPSGLRRIGPWIQTGQQIMRLSAAAFIDEVFLKKPYYAHASFHIGGPVFQQGGLEASLPIRVANEIKARAATTNPELAAVEMEVYLSFDVCSETPVLAPGVGLLPGWQGFESFVQQLSEGAPYITKVGIWGEWSRCNGDNTVLQQRPNPTTENAMQRAKAIVESYGLTFVSEGTGRWDERTQQQQMWFNLYPVWDENDVFKDIIYNPTPTVLYHKAGFGMLASTISQIGHPWNPVDISLVFNWLSKQPDSFTALELMGVTVDYAQPSEYPLYSIEYSAAGRDWIWREQQKYPNITWVGKDTVNPPRLPAGKHLGWWEAHPENQGYTPQEFFDAYFLTPPYPSFLEVLLTDYEKWSSWQSLWDWYDELLTLADAYPNIEITLMVGVPDLGQEQPWVDLEAFVNRFKGHPSVLGFGFMWEYTNPRTYDNIIRADNLMKSLGVRFISYRSGYEGFTPTIPATAMDIGIANFPGGTGQAMYAALDRHTQAEAPYYIGQSAGYWIPYDFPSTLPCPTDRVQRGFYGWQKCTLDIIIQIGAAKDDISRHALTLCSGWSNTPFIGVSGKTTTRLWDNPLLRQWIWENPSYQGNFVLSTIPTPPPPTGILSIDTVSPKGEVFVDNVSWGIAPQSRVLEVGAHLISYGTVAGYYTPSARTVNVLEDQTISVTGLYVVIPPPPVGQGTVQVDTAPPKGEIFIGGNPIGLAPQIKNLDVGSYVLSFGQVEGYDPPPARTVQVIENQIITILAQYTEKPPPDFRYILVPVAVTVTVIGIAVLIWGR